MVATASLDAVKKLDGTVNDGPSQRDVQLLKQMTDLFLSNVERLRESQISAFDELLVPLIDRTEASALVHLSEALSTVELAPGKTICKLAFHNDALAAAPVLRNSSRLSETDLIEIAGTHSQQHLLAICDRKTLSEALTDALMRRGDVNVSNALARNAGAKFSECGYATLVGRAERDESLTEKLGLRLDLPANLLREILSKAADIVLARFLTAPRPVPRKGQGPAGAAAPTRPKIDYSKEQSEVVALNRVGKLTDSLVNRFAVRSEYKNVIAALSLKTDVKIEAIEPLIESDRLYGLIVACKAAKLSWSATKMIIRNRPGCPPATEREFEQAQVIFEGLLLSVAQWTIRFGADRMEGKKVDRPARAG
jgi:uncharacterized protein (DUF2336 family)